MLTTARRLTVALLIVLLFVTVALGPLSAETKPDPDTRIRFEGGGGQCFGLDKLYRLEGECKRVVGRGGPGDIDSTGKLVNPAQYVADGVIAENAKLTIKFQGDAMTWSYMDPTRHLSCGPYKLHFTVKVNGNPLAKGFDVTYCDDAGPPVDSVTLDVPIQHLRFASKGLDSSPEPASQTNVVELSGPGLDSPLNPECGDHGGCGLYEVYIDFEAVAPVVFVHGMNSGPEAFDEFARPFAGARMGYEAVRLRDGSIRGIGAVILKSEVERTAREFGSNYVHIVSHSKGGLWSRALLDQALPQNLGVYSLTTLDTPHHGSVGADFKMAYRQAGKLQVIAQPELGLGLFGEYTPSVDDLTVQAVEAFNKTWVRPETTSVNGNNNTIRYVAHSADANLNGNIDPLSHLGIIETNECGPWPYVWPACKKLYSIMQTYRQVDMIRVPAGVVFPWTNVFHIVPATPPWPLNDFIVTVPSANYPGFTPAFGTNPANNFWHRNHATILDFEVGEFVRRTINVKEESKLRR
jgi:hypothetical protein